MKDPARKTDLTGHAKVDIKIPSQPAGVRVVDRLRGTFAFNGPHAVAEGYEARNVQVSGSLAGPRITLDAARGAAYGGTFTARGFIVTPAPRPPGVVRPARQGGQRSTSARLPPRPAAPARDDAVGGGLSRQRRRVRVISGTATLNESVVEGATLACGHDRRSSG